MPRHAQAVFATIVVGVGLAGAGYLWSTSRARAPERLWAQFDTYCVECHNRADQTAGIAFDSMSIASIAEESETFEAVVRKLRANMMPPPGEPQLDSAARNSLAEWLETSLDAGATPDPAHIALHRLNRTEYANAVEDLLALRVDPATLLPKDDVSDGFDNVANVLKVSPSFLEQYIDAARAVSVMAIGDPETKLDSRVYYNDPNRNQSFHIDGFPLGTRGGMSVEHFFPADGTYEFDIGGLARARYVEGLEYRHRLVLTIDGVKVFEDELGGAEDLEAVDLRQAAAVAEINSRFEDIRVDVTAGPHEVTATFVARTLSESDAVLQPFIPGGGEVGIIEGEESPLKITRLQIDGPLEPKGLSRTPSRDKVFTCYPESETQEAACAHEILAGITRHAFRRVVTDADLQTPLRFYELGRRNADFETGIRNALMIVLASPEFLYRIETAPADLAPGSIYALDDFALASRLAFFLWSSLPDDELLALAERGELRDHDVLSRQVERMLADPRAMSLVTNFAAQWLDVRNVRAIVPDPVLYPEFNPDLGDALARELELFVASILLEDRSVLELLAADHSFVNERLALHYGIPGVRGDQFREVVLADENRWGLLGKGAILMATSYPNRTAPVLRGAWILESIVGVPPPSPPPNVEAFPENQEGEAPRTVRERLEAHRENPTCNSCHGIMDPLGFALEGFDAVGARRSKDRETATPIDSTGQLASGTVVDGPVDLRAALLADPDRFAQTLTEKLLIFALGRSIEAADMPAVRKIVRGAAAEDYRFSALLEGIVTSEPFRLARKPEV